MYSGNTPRKKNVADFRLEAREERTGEDIIVPMSNVDYLALPRAGSDPGPQQYQSLSRHVYGSTSIPLHVNRDVDGVTLAVPEPTAKEAEMYKKVIQEQERQAQPATPQ